MLSFTAPILNILQTVRDILVNVWTFQPGESGQTLSTQRALKMVRLWEAHKNIMAPNEIVALETIQMLHQYPIMSKQNIAHSLLCCRQPFEGRGIPNLLHDLTRCISSPSIHWVQPRPSFSPFCTQSSLSPSQDTVVCQNRHVWDYCHVLWCSDSFLWSKTYL